MPAPAAREQPLEKLTWSAGRELTRLRFAGIPGVAPEVERASEQVLRVDVAGVVAGDTPRRLPVATPQVVEVVRVPASARHLLPEGVSERWLVRLADPSLQWDVELGDDGFVLYVGEPHRIATPAARPLSEPVVADSYVDRAGPADEPPEASERLSPPVPFRVATALPARTSPSSLAPVFERIPEGEVRVADAQRGDWLHLGSGGWLRHALPVARRTRQVPRTPIAWSVVTLGTGLSIEVSELKPGRDEEAAAAASLFRTPVQLLSYAVAATSPVPYGFRFPPKEGRLVLTMKDGRRVVSLDPLELPRAPGVSRDRVAEAFASPEIFYGQSWVGLLVLPGDFDAADVAEARIDVGGRLHRLFRVPGSGEVVEQYGEEP